MSFEAIISYERRDAIHTSRWKLDGVSTTSDGNTAGGWLWMNAARSGDTLTVDLYKDDACGSGDKVASGTADISGVDDAAVKLALSEANSSGISGELYVEGFAADAEAVPVLVSLCADAHLANEYRNLASLPNYDETAGMAAYCAAATEKVLLLASQVFREQLGGCGAGEHRHLPGAARRVPDYRRISQPKQLRAAAVHCALGMIFWSGHEMGDQETMYSDLGRRHERRYDEAVSNWNLAINSDPDADDGADTTRGATAVDVERT